MQHKVFLTLLWILFIPFVSFCDENKELGLTVDLREPTFSDGVLSTEKGGVIQAPNIRIQARKLIYTRKDVDDHLICTLQAEGDLILEFGDYYFIGDSIEYDFIEKTGIIYHAKLY